jgi:GT2 family glycosyltransferase
MVDLSIIIVNYNSMAFIEECLASIARHADVSHEVIIVDNASTDDSVTFIRRHFPEVKLVESKKNLGFARGNNLGAQYASGRFLLLLNNDTKLLSPLSPVLDFLKRHEDAGIAGARLLNLDGTVQFSVGYYHNPLRLLVSWMLPAGSTMPEWGQLYEKKEQFYQDSHNDLDWITGAFMLIKRDVWDQLKGMDSSFFMYMEDVDFCQRAKSQGWKTVYTPDVSLIHYEGGGEGWRSLNAFLYTMDSYRIYLCKHYGYRGWWMVKLFLPPIMLCRGILHVFADIMGMDREGMKKGRIYAAAAWRLVGCQLRKTV